MSKKEIANFFRKQKKVETGFNLLPQASNVSRLFQLQELDASEVKLIEELIATAGGDKDAVSRSRDIGRLKNLTAEVKSISKQGVILIGERIAAAREIFKTYADGQVTFTKWLTATFGSRRTPYNTLSYYEFHEALPTEKLKEKLKTLPLKAAYALASRKGEIGEKIKVVAEYEGEKPEAVMISIRERFPLGEKDKRQKSINFAPLEKFIAQLEKTKLSPSEEKHVQQLAKRLEELLYQSRK